MTARGRTGHRFGRMVLACILGAPLALVLVVEAKPGSQLGDSHRHADLAAVAAAEFGLRTGRLVRVDIDTRPDGSISVSVPARAAPRHLGRMAYLDLQPFSVRATDYALFVQPADGVLEEAEPGPIRTYRGVVRGMPDTVVAAALRGDRLEARIRFADREDLWLQPLAPYVEGAAPDQYLAYHSGDIVATGARCAVGTAAAPAARASRAFSGAANGRSAGVFRDTCTVAEIAIDVDVEFFRAYGSMQAIEERIFSIINALNLQFETEAGITHSITAVVVRTAEPDPYGATDPAALARECRDAWLQQHDGIRRDLTQLFTGRDLDGDAVGWAWSGSVGDPDAAYSVVQSDGIASYAGVVDLSAHELGHNWSAAHCPDGVRAYTMNQQITGANRFNHQTTIPTIVAFRDTFGGADEHDDGTTSKTPDGGATAANTSADVSVAPPKEEKGPGGCDDGDNLANRIQLKDFPDGLEPVDVLHAPDPPGTGTRQLNVFAGTTYEPLLSEMTQDVDVVPIFYHVHFDPEATGTVDVERLRSFIPEKIPDAEYDGLVCLDMEGPYTKGLLAEIGSEEWEHAVQQMALAADVLREMRPHARISYWGVPHIWWFTTEHGEHVPWSQASEQMRQWSIDRWCAPTALIERIDWFTPCFYDPYPVAYLPEGDALSESGAAFFVEVCRAMKPQAPVLPSIAPRTYNMNHEWFLELLPEAEFISDQLEPALESADGFVWWGTDRWHYTQNAIPSEEIEPGLPWEQAWEEYFLPLHRQQYHTMQVTADQWETDHSP
jgi:hypothetical protein